MVNMWYLLVRILMYIYGNMKLIPDLAEAKALPSHAPMSISIAKMYQWPSLGLEWAIHGDYKMQNKMGLTTILMRSPQPTIPLRLSRWLMAMRVHVRHLVAPIALFTEPFQVHPTLTSLIEFQQHGPRRNYF